MANMIPISTVTVGSGGVASIDFVGIPQNYTDLLVKVSARATSSNTSSECRLRINSDAGANYDWVRIYGDGGAAVSQKGSTIGAPYTSFVIFGGVNGNNPTANTFGNAEVYLSNYSSTSYQKSMSQDGVTENNSADSYVFMTAGIWKNTSPITSVGLTLSSGNFVQYTTATLYGIRKY
jgi:hypothetical protein